MSFLLLPDYLWVISWFKNGYFIHIYKYKDTLKGWVLWLFTYNRKWKKLSLFCDLWIWGIPQCENLSSSSWLWPYLVIMNVEKASISVSETELWTYLLRLKRAGSCAFQTLRMSSRMQAWLKWLHTCCLSQ